MATALLDHILSREARYHYKGGDAIQVKIDSGPVDSAGAVQSKLLDLSRGGAKLELPKPFAVSDVLTVRLTSPEIDLNLQVSGRVCWLRPLINGNWWLGCSFAPKLPETLLERMASLGSLERRREPRHPVGLPVAARWELCDECTNVLLRDISPSGVCVVSKAPIKLGTRVRLILPGSEEAPLGVTARAQWEMTDPNGFLVGCEMLERGGFRILKEFVERQHAPKSIVHVDEDHQRKWVIIGAGVAATIGMAVAGGLFR